MRATKEQKSGRRRGANAPQRPCRAHPRRPIASVQQLGPTPPAPDPRTAQASGQHDATPTVPSHHILNHCRSAAATAAAAAAAAATAATANAATTAATTTAAAAAAATTTAP